MKKNGSVTVCVVRHGETDWNKLNIIQGRENIPLNKTGEEQAKNCGLRLKKTKWDLMITSPLERAVKTGAIISDIVEVKSHKIFPSLIEIDFGIASGKSKSEVRAKYQGKDIPGAETKEQLNERCLEILKKLENYEDKRIILVTHAGVVRGILSILDPKNKAPEIPNASVTMIRFEDGKWSLDRLTKPQKALEI